MIISIKVIERLNTIDTVLHFFFSSFVNRLCLLSMGDIIAIIKLQQIIKIAKARVPIEKCFDMKAVTKNDITITVLHVIYVFA